MLSPARDYVLVLDFASRFADRGDELLSHSAYRVLRPRFLAEAVEAFHQCRGQIAFILAAYESKDLASAMQSTEADVPVFLFDPPPKVIDGGARAENGRLRQSWLSILGTFP
jgi:hypothetical protein